MFPPRIDYVIHLFIKDILLSGEDAQYTYVNMDLCFPFFGEISHENSNACGCKSNVYFMTEVDG